jgi:carbon starvation protein
LEELWRRIFKRQPRILKNYWVNSGIAVVLMFILAVTNGYRLIWPIFGASNQLLAAMTLIAVTAWLNLMGRKSWFTLIPAVIMVVTTMASLLYSLAVEYIPKANVILSVTDIILLVLSVGVILQTIRKSVLAARAGKAATNSL